MRAIIPVAGLGSRLKPHTYSIPKVLMNVGGKPILGHIIDKLISEDINKATFIIGHLGELIQEYVTTTYPALQSEFVIQHKMEGLGHAIYTAIPTVSEKEVFIILGDTVFDVNLKEVFKNKKTALGVKSVEDPSRFGVAVMADGYIEKLVEKPQTFVSKLALVGLYYIADFSILQKSLINLVENDIRTKGELQLTDALQNMIECGEKITTFPVEGWYDCGKPETLLSTNKHILDQKSTHKQFPGVVIDHPVFIGDNSILENCVIGPYTTIGSGAVIRNSIIRNSIIGSKADVQKALLDNSIIGSNSSIKGAYKRLNSGDSSEIDFR